MHHYYDTKTYHNNEMYGCMVYACARVCIIMVETDFVDDTMYVAEGKLNVPLRSVLQTLKLWRGEIDLRVVI